MSFGWLRHHRMKVAKAAYRAGIRAVGAKKLHAEVRLDRTGAGGYMAYACIRRLSKRGIGMTPRGQWKNRVSQGCGEQVYGHTP